MKQQKLIYLKTVDTIITNNYFHNEKEFFFAISLKCIIKFFFNDAVE
jgi:hypothetical protein